MPMELEAKAAGRVLYALQGALDTLCSSVVLTDASKAKLLRSVAEDAEKRARAIEAKHPDWPAPVWLLPLGFHVTFSEGRMAMYPVPPTSDGKHLSTSMHDEQGVPLPRWQEVANRVLAGVHVLYKGRSECA